MLRIAFYNKKKILLGINILSTQPTRSSQDQRCCNTLYQDMFCAVHSYVLLCVVLCGTLKKKYVPRVGRARTNWEQRNVTQTHKLTLQPYNLLLGINILSIGTDCEATKRDLATLGKKLKHICT